MNSVAIELDEMKVTQAIGEVRSGFQNIRVDNVQCQFGKSTIKIVTTLPESMNQLMMSLEQFQTLGNQMAVNIEQCKNQIVEMDNKINQAIKSSTMEISGEGN